MGLGIVADTISEDFGYAVKCATDWRIPHIEIYHLWHKPITDLTESELDRAASLVEASDLTVSDIAGLVMRCPPTDDAEQEHLAVFERAVEAGHRLGTDRIRCYAYLKQPDLDTVWDRILRTFDKLVALAEARNVTLLLENSSYANLQTAVELRRLLDAIDHPRLQLLWDAGNAFALGDPTPTVDAWHMLKDRIVHLHLKDSVAHGSNEWVPIGTGAFNLSGLMEAMAKDGYRGVISLETYFDDTADRHDKIRTSVVNVRQAMGEAGL